MAVFQVSRQDYEIMASIFKDGAGMRRTFTAKELIRTLEHLGFSSTRKGRWKYEGKSLFVFKPCDKGRTAISYARQDEMKQQMASLFGWAKDTFVERLEL